MAEEKKIEALQDEIKLLKGELKNSLTSVREYLLNMELPSSEFSTILAALGGGDNNQQKITMDGNVGNKADAPLEDSIEQTEQLGENPEGTPPEDENLLDVENPEDELAEGLPDETSTAEGEPLGPEDSIVEDEEQEEELIPEDEIPEEEILEEEEPEEQVEEEEEPLDELDETDEETLPEEELPAEEEQPMASDQTSTELTSVPKVNMLANLINWVARAKKEIGYEQLATFLEVYGVSGHLTPELKEVIIHLAEITRECPDALNDADIWSQSMLSLHGILTGGDAPLHPVIPSWKDVTDEAETPAEEEIIEIDKNKEKPVKLKLVFPNGNGQNKEFCINLTPDGDNNPN